MWCENGEEEESGHDDGCEISSSGLMSGVDGGEEEANVTPSDHFVSSFLLIIYPPTTTTNNNKHRRSTRGSRPCSASTHHGSKCMPTTQTHIHSSTGRRRRQTTTPCYCTVPPTIFKIYIGQRIIPRVVVGTVDSAQIFFYNTPQFHRKNCLQTQLQPEKSSSPEKSSKP